jgi:hypothetical protein
MGPFPPKNLRTHGGRPHGRRAEYEKCGGRFGESFVPSLTRAEGELEGEVGLISGGPL